MSSFGIAPKIPKIKKPRAKIIKNNFEISDIFENVENENNILITGQVQSGKTKWIIDIISEAIKKYHYNLIIILGGYNKKLLNQTHDRLKRDLKNINPETDTSFAFKVQKWDNNSEEIIWRNEIINVLKNSENIKALNKKIENLTFEAKILVIDDECDFFSVKNKVSKNNEKKSVYNNLKKLYQLINNYKNSLYINVTATPYANIINNYDQDFSIQSLYTLPIKDEYNGFDYFIKKHSDKHFITSKDFFDQNEETKYARIITFWLIQTILYFKNTSNKISEMIIFEDIEIENHLKTKLLIQKTLTNKELFYSTFNEIKNIYFKDDQIELNDFENILNKLISENENGISILNKEYKENQNDINIYCQNDEHKLIIYIGGNLLSRGLTFENLILEYFDYLPKSVSYDTLLQRCRWFGYRNNNNLLNYLKIICELKTFNEILYCSECVDFFFNNETKNGSKLDLKLTREKISEIKKSTSQSKKG